MYMGRTSRGSFIRMQIGNTITAGTFPNSLKAQGKGVRRDLIFGPMARQAFNNSIGPNCGRAQKVPPFADLLTETIAISLG